MKTIWKILSIRDTKLVWHSVHSVSGIFHSNRPVLRSWDFMLTIMKCDEKKNEMWHKIFRGNVRASNWWVKFSLKPHLKNDPNQTLQISWYSPIFELSDAICLKLTMYLHLSYAGFDSENKFIQESIELRACLELYHFLMFCFQF